MNNSLKKALEDGFKIFSRFGKERRTEFLDACKYIENLSNSTSIRCDEWDLIEVFGTGEGNAIVTEPTEINKRFFAHFNKLTEEKPLEIMAVETEILKQIDEMNKAKVEEMLQKIRRQRDDHATQANSYYEGYLSQRAKAVEMETKLRTINVSPDTRLSGRILKIVKGAFYNFEAFKNPFIIFSTRSDVIVRKKNPAAGLDIEVNLGKFRIKYDIRDNKATVHPHENNFGRHGHIHPYIQSGNGKICWGNVQRTADALAVDQKVDELFDLLSVLLTTIGDGTPYMSIEKFYQEFQETGQPINKATPVNPEQPQSIFYTSQDSGVSEIVQQQIARSVLNAFDPIYIQQSIATNEPIQVTINSTL